MKKALIIQLLVLVLLSLSKGYSQTLIQGIIQQDTTLTQAGNPYIFNEVTIDSLHTMIIEEGVQIFADSVSIDIRGTLIVNGTKSSPVRFLQNILNEYTWGGIHVFPGGSVAIQHASVERGIAGFVLDSAAIAHISNVYFNRVNIGVYSTGAMTSIDSCRFDTVRMGVWGHGIQLSNSVFESEFQARWGLIVHGSEVTHCRFENCFSNELGPNTAFTHCEVADCFSGISVEIPHDSAGATTIRGNSIKGISRGPCISINLRAPIADNTLTITDNVICGENLINVLVNYPNPQSDTIDLEQNCWCLSDSQEIANRMIWRTNNAPPGFSYSMDFSPFQTSCFTTGIPTAVEHGLCVYPNPSQDGIFNIDLEAYNTELELSVYNLDGKKVLSKSIAPYTQGTFINLQDKAPGVFILELITEDTRIIKRLMSQPR